MIREPSSTVSSHVVILDATVTPLIFTRALSTNGISLLRLPRHYRDLKGRGKDFSPSLLSWFQPIPGKYFRKTKPAKPNRKVKKQPKLFLKLLQYLEAHSSYIIHHLTPPQLTRCIPRSFHGTQIYKQRYPSPSNPPQNPNKNPSHLPLHLWLV